MATLDWISVSGFKSLAAVEVDLRPINVLIGANGSGKSNFLGVFEFLNAMRNGRLQNYVAHAGGADKLLHFGSKTTREISIRISFYDDICQYEIRLECDSADGIFPSKEHVYEWSKREQKYDRRFENFLHRGEAEVGISDSEIGGQFTQKIRTHLDRWLLYRLHDTGSVSPMKRMSDINDNRILRADGSNLAAFLYRIYKKHPKEYDLIRRTVALAAPFFEDFILDPLVLNEEKIQIRWKHKGSDEYFTASSFSDGTLRFIALTTLLLQPISLRPSMIFMDEPELGLHPYAITLLASLVQQASVDTQIVLATQSPILLDHFDPEDVLVADRVRGASEFTRLDGKALKEWLEDYSLGQLWEKNELGGRPAPENAGGKRNVGGQWRE